MLLNTLEAIPLDSSSPVPFSSSRDRRETIADCSSSDSGISESSQTINSVRERQSSSIPLNRSLLERPFLDRPLHDLTFKPKNSWQQSLPNNLPNKWKSSSRRQIPKTECSFCKKNGEQPCNYNNHVLRDPYSNIVICPILRMYSCPICNNGGGDYAHTMAYCPLNKDGGPSFPVYLQNRPNSIGRFSRRGRARRY